MAHKVAVHPDRGGGAPWGRGRRRRFAFRWPYARALAPPALTARARSTVRGGGGGSGSRALSTDACVPSLRVKSSPEFLGGRKSWDLTPRAPTPRATRTLRPSQPLTQHPHTHWSSFQARSFARTAGARHLWSARWKEPLRRALGEGPAGRQAGGRLGRWPGSFPPWDAAPCSCGPLSMPGSPCIQLAGSSAALAWWGACWPAVGQHVSTWAARCLCSPPQSSPCRP